MFTVGQIAALAAINRRRYDAADQYNDPAMATGAKGTMMRLVADQAALFREKQPRMDMRVFIKASGCEEPWLIERVHDLSLGNTTGWPGPSERRA